MGYSVFQNSPFGYKDFIRKNNATIYNGTSKSLSTLHTNEFGFYFENKAFHSHYIK